MQEAKLEPSLMTESGEVAFSWPAMRKLLIEMIVHERRGRRRELAEAIAANAWRMPPVAAWSPGIYRDGRLVTHDGGLWQAVRDTASEPPHENWRLLVSPGQTPRVRGTFAAAEAYRHLDIVALNGASFIARRDAPGACPGDGWQLVAAQGKRVGRGAGLVAATTADDGTLTLRNGDGSSVRVDLAPLIRRLAAERK